MRTTPLAERLKAEIAAQGPVSVARLMALALSDPVHGYYATRDPFGAGGDFVTAPEISQMFGELIGLWAADRWDRLGRPQPVHLVELGPGRGTLMADALRAVQKAAPEFAMHLRIDLVETSPLLKAKQAETLSTYRPRWHSTVAELPDAPLIVIANEFFDALPIRQFELRAGAWHERLVGLQGTHLAFGLAPAATRLEGVAEADEGAVIEWPEEGLTVLRDVAQRLTKTGGAALIIDYGHARSGFADTLQAVRGHAFVDPLSSLGEADLTAHVDFQMLAKTAMQTGLTVESLTTQADFLASLGLAVLAERLKRRATPAQADSIEAALRRLTDRAPTGMGQLFKVLVLGAPLPHSSHHSAP